MVWYGMVWYGMVWYGMGVKQRPAGQTSLRALRCGVRYGRSSEFPSLGVVIDVEIIMCCGHGAALYGTVIFLGVLIL